MGNLEKDTTESDLWAFDDLDGAAEEVPQPLRRSAGPVVPAPRDPEKTKGGPKKDAASAKAGGGDESIKVNVSKQRPKISAAPVVGQSKPGREFDDLDGLDELDHWDELVDEPVVLKILPEDGGTPAAAPEPAPVEVPQTPVPAPAEEVDEFSPVAKNAGPSAARFPKMNLTKVERIGLVALLAVLLVGGTTVFLNTISRLPTGSELVKENDFPLKGTHLTIVSAASHWRAPGDSDTVRRGTQLVPVLTLQADGGPAAIRVFFRDSNGELIGDPVTRLVRAGSKLEIGATAGFDDVGMHAAYRTGQSKPWTIQVHEAPTENSPVAEFKKLFEMNISTDRR